jgi:hypothetical protein
MSTLNTADTTGRCNFSDAPLFFDNFPSVDDGNGMTGWVEIFRAGDYGERGKYGATELARFVENFGAEVVRVPLTRDHIREGHALGWVRELKVEGDVLMARFGDVDDWTREAVNRGMWGAVSIEAWTGVPIGLPAGVVLEPPTLSAVTLLGASQPAVKGLKQPKFSDVAGNSAPSSTPVEKPATDLILNYMETKPMPTEITTQDQTDRVAELESKLAASESAASKFRADAEAASAERDKLKATIGTFSERLDVATKQIAQLNEDKASAEFDRRFSDLVKSGKVTPAEREILRAQHSANRSLDSVDGAAEIKFGDQTFSHVSLFWHGLETRQPVVEFGQLTQSGGSRSASSDPDLALSEAIKSLAAEKNLTYPDAMKELRRTRPALFADAEAAVI